ncbi:hypothetical protein [Roseateles terrae]|uniref:DUF1351 domain-containing protein n=1 Tax=Roseateles terrae TaxID=431060 RepID=A0ABR6GQK0_9BURK|nr:hypothetical protein [Roseateles terrae]MBB3193981.1 hypothetical protein [Roseateles terrae]OWQ87855.1 hypothetical protein CDN98_06730 [Roseateles terrae]
MSETIEVADELIDRADIKDGKAVVQFSKTEAALAELRQRHGGVQFDLTTTAGDKAARAARLELVTLRTDLEKKRQAFKAPVLEMGKVIDAQAKRITGEILELEQPIDAQIKAEEARKEAIRAEKARIEAERVAAHRAAIEKIRACLTRAQGLPSERVRNAVAAVEGIEIDPAAWEDFAEEAATARTETLTSLKVLLEQTEAKEAEAERQRQVAEEQARIAREQAEAAERLAEQQRQIAAQQAALEAERLAKQRLADEFAARVTGRFAEFDRLLTFTEQTSSATINAALLLASSNAPSVDTFGDRLGEAQKKHALVLEHLQAALPGALRREEAEETARLAREAEAQAALQAAEAAAAAAAEATASRAAIVPVAEAVTQVRQPTATLVEEPTLRIADINAAIKPFSIDAAGMASLGLQGTKRGAAMLFKRSDLIRLTDLGADLLLTAGTAASLEKAA